MVRNSINTVDFVRIADLALNGGLAGRPQAVTNQLCQDFVDVLTDEESNRLLPCKHESHIKKPTVEKYMRLIKEGGIDVSDLLEFEWPRDIGSERGQVPPERERHALDCVGYYVTEWDTKPMLGLVQRFAQVAFASPGWDNTERAPMAERLWYADLVEKVPNQERPSTKWEELYLATKAWNDPDKFDAWAEEQGISRLTISLPLSPSDRLFSRFLPQWLWGYKSIPVELGGEHVIREEEQQQSEKTRPVGQPFIDQEKEETDDTTLEDIQRELEGYVSDVEKQLEAGGAEQ